MEENLEKLLLIKGNQLIKAFENHNMLCMFVENEEELIEKYKIQLEIYKKALEEANIKFDYISGTSSGSIVATLYAMGISPYYIYILSKK